MVLSFFLLLFFVSLVGLNIGWVLANRFVFIFVLYYLCTYEDRLWFGIAKSETRFPFVSALTFRYLCWYEDRLRFGIVKSETCFRLSLRSPCTIFASANIGRVLFLLKYVD